VESQYSKQATTRDWSNPTRTPLKAMLDPATGRLYLPGAVDLLETDKLSDTHGEVWRIVNSRLAARTTNPDINITVQPAIQQWSSPLSSGTAGTVVHVEMDTP